MEHVGDATFTIDFGGGRHAEVDLREPHQVWAAVGPALSTVELWLKTDGPMIDLRVRVRRLAAGIEVAVDRGDTQEKWWPTDAVPRLLIQADHATATAIASARVGQGHDFQEVLLGRTRLR